MVPTRVRRHTRLVFTSLDHGITTGAYGQAIGYMEYRAQPPTAPMPVHVFATFVIADGEVVLATLTSTEATAAQARDVAAEHLWTLMATGQDWAATA